MWTQQANESKTDLTRPKHRILIVEDEPSLQRLWGTALRGKGFVVDIAGDGLDAFAHVLNQHPDLIVLDLGLPGMRGEVLLREFGTSRRTATIPVIVVTGEPELPDLPSQVVVLRKPFNVRELLQAVERCLGEGPLQGR